MSPIAVANAGSIFETNSQTTLVIVSRTMALNAEDPVTTATSTSIDKIGEIVAVIAAQHGLVGPFAPDDLLVDRGMTSMAMVDLMLAVEADFDVTIPQRDLTPANFQSMKALARLLDRL